MVYVHYLDACFVLIILFFLFSLPLLWSILNYIASFSFFICNLALLLYIALGVCKFFGITITVPTLRSIGVMDRGEVRHGGNSFATSRGRRRRRVHFETEGEREDRHSRNRAPDGRVNGERL